jgi:hypothetical protein
VRLLGGFEVLIALLLLLEEEIGGVLFLLYLVVFAIASYIPIIKDSIANPNNILHHLQKVCIYIELVISVYYFIRFLSGVYDEKRK